MKTAKRAAAAMAARIESRFIRVVRVLLRRRAVVLFLCAAVFLAFLPFLFRVRVDNSLEAWFVDGDRNVERYRSFQREFGADEVITVVLPGETTQAAGRLDELERSLSALSNVDQVWRMPGDFGGHAVLVVQPDTGDGMDAVRAPLIRDVRDVLDAVLSAGGATENEPAPGTRPYRLAGIGVVYDALNRISLTDSLKFIGLSSLIILVLLAAVLRRFGFIALASLDLILVLGVTSGLFGLLDAPINMVTMVVPSLVLIYGVSDVIHITLRYYRLASSRPTASREELITEAVASSALPCLLTSLTTCLGFLALAPSRVQVLRDLGLLTAAAVVLTFAFTAAFLSAGFSFLPVPRGNRSSSAPALSRLFGSSRPPRRAGGTSRRSAAVLLIAAGVFLATAGGIFRLEVDTFSIGFLKAGHPVRRDSDYIESNVGFYTPVEFTMTAGEGSFAEPEMLARLQRAAEALEGAEAAQGFLSIADFLPPVKPDHSPDVIRRFLERVPESLTKRFLSSDYRTARITGRVKMAGAAALKETLTDLVRRSPEQVEPAGYLPLYVKIMDYITATQIVSFLIAFVTVFGVVGLYCGSGRLALFAVLANLFPLGVVLGFMGWMGIRLDIATVTVAAVSIGIVVDDTIHFLYRYREASRRPAERRENRRPVTAAMEESAGALVSTSVVLAAGFLGLAFAQINSIMYFGLLSALMIACALAGDLLVLPALLAIFGRKVCHGPAPSTIHA